MNEETKKEINRLNGEIGDLKKQINLSSNSTTIPYNVEQALRVRLRIDEFTPLTTSAKGATSENQAVNEGGVATYSVLKTPDGFIQVVIGSNTYYLPYFS